MDDKKRTLLLGGTLLAVLGLYGGQSFIKNSVIEPVRKLERAVATREQSLEQLSNKEIALGVARRQLDDWRDISLPEDAATAQRLYREWVENLALECSFANLSVEPGRKSDQRGMMLSVGVDVKAETDLAGLSRFMFLFDNAAILHRISNLLITSTGSQGNPRMEVSFTAEGASITGSGIRSELFARTTLAADVADDATEILVSPSDLFPSTTPFDVRIDRELIRVTEISENRWTIERGAVGTKPGSHKASAAVELLPLLWNKKEKQLEDYSSLLSASPFAVPLPPRKYTPKLNGLADQSIRPGQEVRLTVKLEDTDPQFGSTQFELISPPENMAMDPATGEITWQTAETLTDGKYSATVVAFQQNRPEQRFEGQLNVNVTIPNASPTITVPTNLIAVIGQQFQQTVQASDDGPTDQLTFAVSGNVPEGLQIDNATGLISWMPEISQRPGEYSFDIKVTDKGKEPKSATTSLNLQLKEDDAAMTLLTGSVSKDDVWYAWLRNKATGLQVQLRTGDHINAAEIDAEIVSIAPRSILMKDQQGTWKLELGNTVRQRSLVQAAASATPAEADSTESGAVAPTQGSADAEGAAEPVSTTPVATNQPDPKQPSEDAL